jgi:hypothetical protein
VAFKLAAVLMPALWAPIDWSMEEAARRAAARGARRAKVALWNVRSVRKTARCEIINNGYEINKRTRILSAATRFARIALHRFDLCRRTSGSPISGKWSLSRRASAKVTACRRSCVAAVLHVRAIRTLGCFSWPPHCHWARRSPTVTAGSAARPPQANSSRMWSSPTASATLPSRSQ